MDSCIFEISNMQDNTLKVETASSAKLCGNQSGNAPKEASNSKYQAENFFDFIKHCFTSCTKNSHAITLLEAN